MLMCKYDTNVKSHAIFKCLFRRLLYKYVQLHNNMLGAPVILSAFMMRVWIRQPAKNFSLWMPLSPLPPVTQTGTLYKHASRHIHEACIKPVCIDTFSVVLLPYVHLLLLIHLHSTKRFAFLYCLCTGGRPRTSMDLFASIKPIMCL